MVRPRRRGKRRIISAPDISLTPLIDTALTLLIIFMITAPMMQNSIRVALPKGQAKEVEDTFKEIIVSVDKEGNIFLNDSKIDEQNMIEKIKLRVGQNLERTVFVEADKHVDYGRVIQIVDQIKVIGGINYVALATKG